MSSWRDPTTTVSPLMATEVPNRRQDSPVASRQLLLLGPGRAAADKDVGRALIVVDADVVVSAPTTTVSPLMATEKPNQSIAAPPLAVSFCWKYQVEPLRTKT